jgi:hypothetical protein
LEAAAAGVGVQSLYRPEPEAGLDGAMEAAVGVQLSYCHLGVLEAAAAVAIGVAVAVAVLSLYCQVP